MARSGGGLKGWVWQGCIVGLIIVMVQWLSTTAVPLLPFMVRLVLQLLTGVVAP